jgi:hypothetical protein
MNGHVPKLESPGGHSADVRIRLMSSGHSILDAPTDHLPGPASILLRVGQTERRWDVCRPKGISAASKRVAITACG